MRVHVLALDGVFDTGLSTLLDTLGVANDLSATAGTPAVRFDVTVAGVRRHPRTARGLSVPALAAGRCPQPDVALIPALGAKTPQALQAALLHRDVLAAIPLLRRWAAAGALLGSACTGTFVLAGTGLLDGQGATTSWWLAPFFRERYPRIRLDESRMVVAAPGCVTAGAALAHVDLALWLIRRASPALAATVARYLLIEPRPSQSLFAIPDHLAHADPLVERFERWARNGLGTRFSLKEAAAAAGTSERTLSRRLRAALGKSPLAYFQDLRIERAMHLLRTSHDSVDRIAGQVGYAEGATLRTLLRRRTGRSINELRARGAAWTE